MREYRSSLNLEGCEWLSDKNNYNDNGNGTEYSLHFYGVPGTMLSTLNVF